MASVRGLADGGLAEVVDLDQACGKRTHADIVLPHGSCFEDRWYGVMLGD
jgi:hypothetical protein